jgi:hypothetical protein
LRALREEYAKQIKVYDDQYSTLGGNIKDLDGAVAGYLGVGGTVLQGANTIISPYIGGGYLNIASGNAKVIIDPANKQELAKPIIFQVYNANGEMTMGLDDDGNATFDGNITGGTMAIGGTAEKPNFWVESSGTLHANAGYIGENEIATLCNKTEA